MAVINFTPADALHTTVVPAGIYPSQIVKIDGPRPSKSGKSVGFYVDIQITDGPYNGKEKTIAFNSEMDSYSLLGDMQFYPQSSLLLIDAAINNKKVEPVNYALDTDDLVMKPFDAQWGVETVEGRLINTILNFYPEGYGKSVPTF